jgi:replicative DNA helicase Mcm
LTNFNKIPCIDKSKKPAIPWAEYQHKRYTKPVETKNYAIIMGITSGVFVIDIDSAGLIHKLFTNWEKVLENNYVVQTGSGSYHIYFQYDPSITTKRLDNPSTGEHIDIQSQGTYVIGPGSIHPDTGEEYKIISSTQTIRKMTNYEGFIEQLKTLGFETEGSGLKPFQEIAKGKISKGNRNASAFKYAANLIDNVGMDIDTVWAEMQRWNKTLDPPMAETELRITYESAVRKASQNVETPETNERVFRKISAKDEGKEITFKAFISAVDEHRTVTVDVDFVCANNHDLIRLNKKGNGYENVPSVRCRACGQFMATQNAKTNDVRTVLLQELPEEVKNNNPKRMTAKLVGRDALNVFISTRKMQITGKFVSRKLRGKEENEIIIFVKEILTLEDSRDELPTDLELEQILKHRDGDFFDILSKSFAPEILGYGDIKKAILLHLVNGGNTRRNKIHMLIIGNPSKAKSELLKATNEMVESSYINGKMASGAGVAYGMVKLPNGTSVANVGPLGLYKFVQMDELDKMKKEDRAALLEVMEQQSISLTKAGINSHIDADPGILGASNPKYSSYDFDLGLMKNIDFESFFLTRFDLVFGIIKSNPIQDRNVIDYIIKDSLGEVKPTIEHELLVKYLNLARTYEPKLTTTAGKKIGDYFSRISEAIQMNNDEYIPIETRQLQGLIRLSTAHAKLHLKLEVDEDDVEQATKLFEASLDSFGIIHNEESRQSQLADKHRTTEQELFYIITKNLDENRHFDEKPVLAELSKSKFKGEIEKAKKFFERYAKISYLQNADGSYRLVKT